MKTSRLMIVLFLLLALLATVTASAQEETLTLTVNDLERTYSLHVPDGLESPAPLVLVLHGRGGDGEHIAAYTQFSDLADEEQFIAVYPDGLNGEWNFVRNIPGYDTTHDDTAFLVALVDHIAEDYPVDLSRVYITGYSNGGFMAQRAACEKPTRFAAFASVAASGFGGMKRICLEPGTATAPMLLIHGTGDNNIPWNGLGTSRQGQMIYLTYPVPETLGFWAEYNLCQPNAETTDLPESGDSPGTSVRVMTVDCPADAPVVLYGILGGGHNWPGYPTGIPAQIAGVVNMDIDATEVIWQFFAQHQRPQNPEAAEAEATAEAE